MSRFEVLFRSIRWTFIRKRLDTNKRLLPARRVSLDQGYLDVFGINASQLGPAVTIKGFASISSATSTSIQPLT
ncbi:hypothetical protein [Pelagibacterium sp.]|uniref:hypothetical protein n=1 Tax=Pelagibacterium sp. TaxID=1967288 RepID=UPI003A9090FA